MRHFCVVVQNVPLGVLSLLHQASEEEGSHTAPPDRHQHRRLGPAL